MNLPTIRSEQHATILGYSIIAYGISLLIDLIGPINQAYFLSGVAGAASKQLGEFLWPKIVFGIAVFLICWAAGTIIKNRDTSSRAWGLTVVFIVFGFYPIGTLIAAYTLLYLFVIYQSPSERDDQTSPAESQTETQTNE